jgi:hypothetical protein
MERLSFKQFILNEIAIQRPALQPVQAQHPMAGTNYLYGIGSETSATENALQVSSKSGASHLMPGRSAIQKYFDVNYWGDGAQKYVIGIRRGMEQARKSIPELRAAGKVLARTHVRNIDESVNRRGSTTPYSPLYVFDMDNTIANTNSGVLIKHKKTGELIKRLSSAEYARYRPQKHHVADFSEFSKVRGAVAIPEIQRIIGNMARKNRPYMVLTARPQSSSREILRYLRQQGLHTKGVKVVGLGTSDPRAKADYLRSLLSKGRNTKLEFWDDHHENVKHVAGLAKEFPNINIRARHVAYGDTQ